MDDHQRRLQKIERLRIAEAGSGEYDDEVRRPNRWLRLLGWLLLVVVLTAALGAAGWYFWLRHQDTGSSRSGAGAAQTPAPPPPPAETAATSVAYESTPFQLSLKHPEGWRPAEGGNRLTVTSPVIQLPVAGTGSSASGASSSSNQRSAASLAKTRGQVILTIERQQATLPGFVAGEATAARDSERLEYERPSQGQRAATYISFLDLASDVQATGSGSAGTASANRLFEVIYVTGDSGYLAGQAVPQADIVRAELLISLTFRSCADQRCDPATAKPLALPASAWDDAALRRPLESMLRSLVVN